LAAFQRINREILVLSWQAYPMRFLLYVFVALGVIGCRSSTPKNDSPTHTAASSEPGKRLVEENPLPELHAPRDLRPDEKRPLLILLHGLGASGRDMGEHTHFASLAARERLYWTAPEGSIDAQGRRFWEATETCCNFDKKPVDHVGFMRRIIENATQKHAVDPKRVYVIGFSNGGFMAHRLACELSTMLAGIVSISGAGPNPGATCRPQAPIDILEIHADKDPVVTYGGGTLFKREGYPAHIGALETVQKWAARNACDPSPDTRMTVDVESVLQGEETRVTRFLGCKRGRVELWTVVGGGHAVAMRDPGPVSIWKFLEQR
jgi:polyhydroxybutyrate depolymerase